MDFFALKLAMAVAGPDRAGDVFRRYRDLAAVGTVADVMPMTGETEMAMMWSTLSPTDRVSVTSSGSRAMERIRKEWTMLNCSNRMHST